MFDHEIGGWRSVASASGGDASIVAMKSALLLCLVMMGLPGAEFVVAPTGNDDNAGTHDLPFASLERARDAARAASTRGETNHIITIGEGVYRLEATLALDQRDANTTWQAATGAKVELSGGISVAVADLEPVTEQAVLERLPEASRGQVVALPLPGNASGDSSMWPLRFRGYAGWPEVYADGEPLHLARWPNEGYAQIARILDPGSKPRFAEKPDRGGSFQYANDRPGQWQADEPIYLGGYWNVRWYDEFIRVDSIDAATKTIHMAAPHQYGIGGPSQGLYYAINLLEELDRPGEYVYAGKRHVIYVLLPSERPASLSLSLLQAPLVTITNTSNIRFTGVTFANGCAAGVTITDSSQVVLRGCTIQQFSGVGVDISGGSGCGVERCRIVQIGKDGVKLSGGDRSSLTPSGHFVTHSHISHFARLVKTYCPAVDLLGVGQRVAYNHIHDAPHCAIFFRGNDHHIEFNHIEQVCLDTSDAGAIFTGRDWTYGGIRIHGNYIHDLGAASHHFNWSIYIDDMAAGIEVSGNVMVNTDAAMLFGGGRSNRVLDNLVVNCPKQSLMFDARGVGWAAFHINKPGATMWERLEAVPYDQGVWLERFPYLAQIKDDAPGEPRHNVITGNRFYASARPSIHALVTAHGQVADNHHSQLPPQVRLDSGRLDITGEAQALQQYHGLAVGPQPAASAMQQ